MDFSGILSFNHLLTYLIENHYGICILSNGEVIKYLEHVEIFLLRVVNRGIERGKIEDEEIVYSVCM